MSFSSSSSSSSQGGVPPHDFKTQSELTNLYNQHVVSAEHVTRPMIGFSTCVGPVCHSGVRVTVKDGSQYLIHKGPNYGIASDTVVVKDKHMSDRWQVTQSESVQGKTVSDYVKAGGTNYDFIFDNCHHGAGRMMKK